MYLHAYHAATKTGIVQQHADDGYFSTFFSMIFVVFGGLILRAVHTMH